MSGARVLVVEHQGNAGVGLAGQRLANLGLELHTVGPATGRPVPESLDGFDALVVLGGSMGPTEDEAAPWLPATRSLLQQSVEQELPTLGICLGAQLLATATGGRVREMPAGPEVGLNDVAFHRDISADPVFGDLAGATVAAVQWHWLEAETLPADTQLLASSPACANQAFRVGTRAWGVQFHPEALTQTARGWADEDHQNLTKLGLDDDALVGAIQDASPELTRIWGAVADRFAAVVTESVARETEGPGSGS
ncbi:GMP synthase-like glutamine amidotransferase [Leucobacter exalbidus]|uniref:GMP synthase-like glutamine amidotransferase n=1 Tax=Leucobacter exalbidus TaxID=662960 RepID=A0A940PNT1_9MICO|nr:type 1 glutamine amidotransferase [Leucobacter exalbidus]MBP1327382.1 GMP synthase-like glutamine amidotransferase [Leucobacter exalbidus]